jgi:hypothetical protein
MTIMTPPATMTAMAVLFDSRFLGPTGAAVVSSLIVLSFM